MQQQEERQTKQRVGENIRRARNAKNWTQRQLGEAIGTVGPDVSRWENGRIEPGPFYRQALANVLFDGDVAALYRAPEDEAA